ncbi:MAG: cobalamin-independent methionine synthase II family protein [Rhodospirillales bacterium]|nr:MAG: cobalamin-independent methionine synthase II family protein [Rhodospirillales bacterium]
MRLATTTIGAFPKPDYVPISDWFQGPEGPDTVDPTAGYAAQLARAGAEAEALFARAAADVIAAQIAAGIDLPTDGEVRRENYIHYHCRHLDGIDFQTLTEKALRGGAYAAALPTITGPVRARDRFLAHDWRVAQACTDRPVKMTMPGPMTIADTVANDHYDDEAKLGADLAAAINAELLDLAEAGCTRIQIDEPVFARKPDAALDFGFENLERCFAGAPAGVVRTVHMCCGYPDRLDNPDYPKADRNAYFRLADAIEASSIQAVSLEDAHRHNDLKLLERFRTTTVILGAVAVAKSRIETVDEIRERLRAALDHIDSDRLIAAPDCGLGLLGRELAVAKLTNLCAAAHDL